MMNEDIERQIQELTNQLSKLKNKINQTTDQSEFVLEKSWSQSTIHPLLDHSIISTNHRNLLDSNQSGISNQSSKMDLNELAPPKGQYNLFYSPKSIIPDNITPFTNLNDLIDTVNDACEDDDSNYSNLLKNVQDIIDGQTINLNVYQPELYQDKSFTESIKSNQNNQLPYNDHDVSSQDYSFMKNEFELKNDYDHLSRNDLKSSDIRKYENTSRNDLRSNDNRKYEHKSTNDLKSNDRNTGSNDYDGNHYRSSKPPTQSYPNLPHPTKHTHQTNQPPNPLMYNLPKIEYETLLMEDDTMEVSIPCHS
ncbi:hypothetical protein BC833DRAFT_610706 [Globomyces pollinis-pini]|nr:hypothetical protein BC833DRAFT_610706 [Globomyces pollinis-pini]